ncbi:MAG: lysophospholipase [Spirulina sp. SIO3F2]|nr:lysophospholipase [Spirulina sp. SIO3F2]
MSAQRWLTGLKFPRDWLMLSLIANGVLGVIAISLWLRWEPFALARSGQNAVIAAEREAAVRKGQPRSLTYEQWVDLLAQEARVAAVARPERLKILLGDSLSLWFEQQNLPEDWAWLNQGISGEKTLGLLRRLAAVADTEPETIFIMIGINDLLWEVRDETVLANYQLIVQQLQRQHPQAEIVIQSILPHGADRATWEGKAKFATVSNQRIQRLNVRLAAIAQQDDQVHYLDLYALFSDDRGNLKMSFSTDGLHLNAQGYQVWATAIQLFTQIELE